jgi:hypothetical protein
MNDNNTSNYSDSNNNYSDSNNMRGTSQYNTPRKYDKQHRKSVVLFFQRPKYFNSLIYFHNQVTGKNIESIIENLIGTYAELESDIFEELVASYFLNNWIQKKWPPMRSRPLIQTQAKFVIPCLLSKFSTFEATLSNLFLEFFDFTTFFKYQGELLQNDLANNIDLILPNELCGYISTFLYPTHFVSKLNLWQQKIYDSSNNDVNKRIKINNNKSTVHPIYFAKIDNGKKENGFSITNNIYYQLHSVVAQRKRSEDHDCLSTLVSVLQNLNAAGTMLNFTVYTVLPALMYNYYDHPKEKYKCAMIYYIGILFRSLNVKHLSCSKDVDNNDVLSTRFTKQYKKVHRDFSLLIQRCQLKLGGKQQFVINEFKWNKPFDPQFSNSD